VRRGRAASPRGAGRGKPIRHQHRCRDHGREMSLPSSRLPPARLVRIMRLDVCREHAPDRLGVGSPSHRPLVAHLGQMVWAGPNIETDDTTVTLVVKHTPPPLDPDDPRSARAREVIADAQAKLHGSWAGADLAAESIRPPDCPRRRRPYADRRQRDRATGEAGGLWQDELDAHREPRGGVPCRGLMMLVSSAAWNDFKPA
jgi:hypothetical protein